MYNSSLHQRTVLLFLFFSLCLSQCMGDNATEPAPAPVGLTVPEGPCGQQEFDWLLCKNSTLYDTGYCLDCFNTLKTKGINAAYPRPDECSLALGAFCTGFAQAVSENRECETCFARDNSDPCGDRFGFYWNCMINNNWDIIAFDCNPEPSSCDVAAELEASGVAPGMDGFAGLVSIVGLLIVGLVGY